MSSDQQKASPEAGGSQSRALVIRKEDEGGGMRKRIKVLQNEDVFIQNIPSCEAYERSYMHQELLNHVYVTKSQFLITTSSDGVIKFWKKTTTGIEFVKKFKAHAQPVTDISVTPTGSELASVSSQDKTAKVFDVINFDMINMFVFNFKPNCVEWVNSDETNSENLIITDSTTPNIYIFDARQSYSEPIKIINEVHSYTICRLRFNSKFKTIVSADENGTVEYWRLTHNINASGFVKLPFNNNDQSAGSTNTCFNEFKHTASIRLHHINFSQDGKFFITTSSDRKIRIFRFKTGELVRTYDETLERIEETQKNKQIMSRVDFVRTMSIERGLEAHLHNENAIFDQTGNFVLFPSMFGVKVYNWKTNHLIRSLGKEETNFRPLCISLFQGLIFEKPVRKFNVESLESGVSDPMLFCTAYNKNRFYCFSHRYFEEDTAEGENGEIIKDRDIFNEKPKREEIMSAVELEIENSGSKTFENGIIHTTMGDIHIKLFPKQAPKTCENFCVHSKNSYYNNHIFHRVIKKFMIQTGDPTGTGTGGESIWSDDFEDEFCDEFSHGTPFMLSMANRGPNTNGSQFFITVAPYSNLDKKHTIFGKVVRGMDVCLNISQVKTNPKTDKPLKDIKIINIKVF